ncbi:MAG: hypothetical protein FJZ16_03740 [Candidatus Omnitrophica bacterium]|nr:hypothetical protein [Candidatus Omnitrophota bacterium]
MSPEFLPRIPEFCRMITACFYLEKTKAEKKLLVLTDKEFYSRFTKDADGLISENIEVLYIPMKFVVCGGE